MTAPASSANDSLWARPNAAASSYAPCGSPALTAPMGSMYIATPQLTQLPMPADRGSACESVRRSHGYFSGHQSRSRMGISAWRSGTQTLVVATSGMKNCSKSQASMWSPWAM